MRSVIEDAIAQLKIAPDTAELMKSVSLRIDDKWPDVSIDAPLMRQVFVNRIGNALRFANHGPGEAIVRIGVDADCAFYVTDSGPGFPPELAPELFRPFVRMHGGGLSRHGIGLSIVRRIVEAHGGKVWAESRPGEGATFRFAIDPCC